MGWKDILKVLPPSDWIVYPYPEMEEVSSDYRAKAKDIGSTRFIVRPHYLDRLYNVTPEGHVTRKRNTDDLDKWVNCAKNLPVGKYWMYANDDEKDLDVIILNVIRKGGIFPGYRGAKKLDRSITNSETGEQIEKVVFFSNFYGVKGIKQRSASKFKATRFDCFYTGLKPNHKERDVIDAKVKRKVKSISIDDLSSPEKQTKPDATPKISQQERKQNAINEMKKLLRTETENIKGYEINWGLPKNHLKDAIEARIKKLRRRRIYLGKKQKEELDRLIEEVF